jgi:hypothetical protein
MSKMPIDKRRARQPKQPWYLKPITFRVIVLVLRFAVKVLDLFG